MFIYSVVKTQNRQSSQEGCRFYCIKKTTGNAGGSKKLLHEGVDKNTVADLAGHGDTSFLERTYCHPQMQLKQEAAKRMSNSLFAIPNPELLVS